MHRPSVESPGLLNEFEFKGERLEILVHLDIFYLFHLKYPVIMHHFVIMFSINPSNKSRVSAALASSTSEAASEIRIIWDPV